MSAAETKREEAARFIRARCDPVFAKMVRVRQLGPEQVENQKKIRVAVEVSSIVSRAMHAVLTQYYRRQGAKLSSSRSTCER